VKLAQILGNIIKKAAKTVSIFLNSSKVNENIKKISMFSNTDNVFTWKNGLPVGNYKSGVVAEERIYNRSTGSDEILMYVIGGANDSTRLQQITFDNGGIIGYDMSGQVPGSKLPVSFNNHAAVMYNGDVHIFVGTSHYRHIYTGSSTTSGNWTKLSTIPFSVSGGRAVVYNNQIHLFQGTYHYKWNGGSSWTSVSTIPYNFNSGCAFIFQDKINLYGGTGGSNSWYQWNGSSWITITGNKMSCNPGIVIPISNRSLYVISGSDTQVYTAYLNEGSTSANYSYLTSMKLPNSVQYGSAVNIDGTIYIIGSSNTSYYKDIQFLGLKQVIMS
jgi:hypothetical protein